MFGKSALPVNWLQGQASVLHVLAGSQNDNFFYSYLILLINKNIYKIKKSGVFAGVPLIFSLTLLQQRYFPA
jgi:hypothetical protein